MSSNDVQLHRPRPMPRPRPGPGTGDVKRRRPLPDPQGTIAGWAELDPTGVTSRVVRFAQRWPGVAWWDQRVAAPIEARLLQVALVRAQTLLDPHDLEVPEPPATRRLTDMIEESLEQTPTTSKDELYTAMLGRLVHDEVRILAALSDGSVYPLVHIAAAHSCDRGVGYVLANASSVGRMAGVVLPTRTQVYVSNLIHLGLATVGPQDKTLKQEYELLLTESYVIAARTIGDDRRKIFKSRIVRRSLRISDFGRELWDACRRSEDFDPPSLAPVR